MPSIDERREAAARLRKRAANYDGETEAWNELAEAAFGWVWGFEHSDLFEYLADLIEPERTCRAIRRSNEFGYFDLHCSECHHLMMIQRDGSEMLPNFCDECGCRVKEGQ